MRPPCRARNLFSRSLRNMPKDYIARIVFDIRHRTLYLSRQDQVVAGINFRCFPEHAIVEIVFVAVDSSEQVKGFGTYLMNHMKAYALKLHCTALVTFADDSAVGYFSKQGFTQHLTLAPKRLAVAKLYTGGVLMQCELHPAIPYLNLSQMISRQQQVRLHAWLNLPPMRHLSISRAREHIAHAFVRGEGFVAVKDIPGVLEAGWSDAMLLQSKPKAKPAQKRKEQHSKSKRGGPVIRDLRNHSQSWPFREPVDPTVYPEYYETIAYPMDLKTIAAKFKAKEYLTKDDFVNDCNLMLDNCVNYNPPDSDYYRCAELLRVFLQ
ncbi:uncharacterized protein MONBRDRAFT_14245 [Monosiga brevicollis MX1]|uniref:histone acetyltransferase n=1 Tax=Monosiga brevicollis TaxID=81824 RepID=A9URQ8_MONBE|nr:uncharacterized protein MONBRDRAFT_14245 [Monosiga brevicollis MX1]EDQ91649.1 predicted protein [Monosiga brevicollis MX1]|eukprot:XP_001742935.1 hypothetical protein [Monosiga brevicollis MX1]